MPQIPCPYGDQIPAHLYNPATPEADHSRGMTATDPHLRSHTTPRLYVQHTYPSSHFWLPDRLSAPHHDELNPSPSLTYSSFSHSPAENELDGISINCNDLDFLRPSDPYSPWNSLRPPHNLLPSATYGVSPPALHHSTLDPSSYFNLPCQQSSWSAGNDQVNSTDEYLPVPSHHYPPAPPLHNSAAFLRPHVDYTLELYSGTLGASYPCLWTESGVICNVMVQATRSHMNRHLHAHHGFGGSDTRQTRCHWVGCGETMQQGSIARHMVTCHLQAKVTCPMCSKKLSRQDVISKHQRVCPAASAWR